MKSEEKQYDLFSKQENTSTLKSPSMESTKSDAHGTILTENFSPFNNVAYSKVPRAIQRRNKHQQRKRDLVALKGGCCEKCGGEFHPNVFDFHHIDAGEKKFPLKQRNLCRTWESIVAEADKCAMLCANCHREVHTFNDPRFIKSNH